MPYAKIARGLGGLLLLLGLFGFTEAQTSTAAFLQGGSYALFAADLLYLALGALGLLSSR